MSTIESATRQATQFLKDSTANAVQATSAGAFASYGAAALSGYQTAQTPSDLDDVAYLGTSTYAGFAAGGPWGAAIAAVAFVVGNVIGRRKARERESEIRSRQAQRIITLRPEAVVALPYVFGRFRRELLPIYAAVGENPPLGTVWVPPANGRQRLFGQMLNRGTSQSPRVTTGDAPYDGTGEFRGPGGGTNDPYLLVQYDICAGGVDRLYDIRHHDRPIHTDTTLKDQVLARLGLAGTADTAAIAFVPSAFSASGEDGTPAPARTTFSSFTDKSYVTACFWAARRDPNAWQDRQIPLLESWGHGPQLARIVRTGAGTNTEPSL